MTYPNPEYKETFNLNNLKSRKIYTNEVLDAAAGGVLRYMMSELFMPGSSGMDGSVVKYSGLAKNGSLVILQGLRPDREWQSANVTVVNMQEKDEGLVRLLKKAAIEATKK